jgi:cell wall-associated NlpC family hydrolase
MIAAQVGGGSGTPVSAVPGPSAAASPTATLPLPTVSRPVGKLSPSTGAYVGAYTNRTGLTSTDSIEAYFKAREGLAGRNFAIHNFMPGWNQPLASDLVRWDLAQGTIPLISWNTPDGVSDQAIADGSQDAWIRTEADGVKALGADVFLRLDWEMNGNWFAWDGTHNGGSAAPFVAMWRHIHDVFVQQGATNVAWVWTPSSASLPNTPWNAMTAYYPGDDYVDWIGEDDYNYGGTLGHSGGWNAFTSQLQPLYGTFATRKPIMIGEMGSADGIPGHDKGQWISQMAADVKTNYPDVQALVWFDVKYDADWRFDTSPGSLQAFRAWLADPYYNPSSRAENVGAPGSACVGDGGDGDPTGPPGGSGPPATTTLPSGFTITGSPAGTKAVQYALAQLGKPYVYGTSGPASFDCSGLTMAAWAAAGVSLPHFTGDQVHAGTAEPADLSAAQAGDLVFIPGADGTPTDPRHVGMVAGTTTDAAGTHLWLVEAPHTGANVELIDVTRWAGRIAAVRHIG